MHHFHRNVWDHLELTVELYTKNRNSVHTKNCNCTAVGSCIALDIIADLCSWLNLLSQNTIYWKVCIKLLKGGKLRHKNFANFIERSVKTKRPLNGTEANLL